MKTYTAIGRFLKSVPTERSKFMFAHCSDETKVECLLRFLCEWKVENLLHFFCNIRLTLINLKALTKFIKLMILNSAHICLY